MGKSIVVQRYSDKIATFNGDAIDLSGYRSVTAQLIVDLKGSPTSPTLDVAMQTSNDGVTWAAMPSAWAFTQKTADANEFKQLAADLAGRFIRFVFTIGGSGYEAGVKTWNTIEVHVAGA